LLLAAPDGLWDICCQQAAEKYLKGLLVVSGRPYPRIHDLAELARVLTADHPEIAQLVAAAAWLTDAGSQACYPAVEEPCDRADAVRAPGIAQRIRAFCRERLTAHGA
jgi:HEPN domain-containing protein